MDLLIYHSNKVVKYPKTIYRPAMHPIYFAVDLPGKIIAALRGRYLLCSLVEAKSLHLLTQTVLPLKSPTRAFITPQVLISKKTIRTHLLSETSSDYFCLVRVARIELTAS